jgi:tetratricopeptide (TPR) repeat protein
VRLQDVKTGRIVTSESAQGPSQSDLFQMVDDLSRRIQTKFAELRPGAAPGALVSQPGAVNGTNAGLDRGLGDVTTSSIEAYKEYAEGINLHERSRESEAVARFEKAIALDASFAMAYAKLAVVQNNTGHPELSDKYAALALQHADRLTPRERFYIEGYYYAKRSDTLARGLDAYKKCVELDPGHQACRHNLALQLMFLERFQEAVGHYEELVRRGATNPSTYENLTNSYIALGESEKAAATMEQFVKRNPESAAGHRSYGYALFTVRRDEEALKELSQSELLNPADPQPTAGRVYANLLLENWGAARATATSLEASSDAYRRYLGALAASLVEEYAGRCAEMIAATDRAVAAFKQSSANTAFARVGSSDALLACGRPAPAVATLEKAVVEVKGDSSETEILASFASALAVTGRATAADDEVARIAAMVSPLTAVRDGRVLSLARGLVALARKDFPTAIDQLQKSAAALSPGSANFFATDHVPTWFALGQAYLSEGRPKDAAPWFQKIVDSNLERLFLPIPYIRSFYYLGTIRELSGDTAGAREAYRRFVGYWQDGTIDRDKVAEAERKLQTLK